MVLRHTLVLFHPFEVCHSGSGSSGFQVSLCVKLVVTLICIINSLFCKCAVPLGHLLPLLSVELYLYTSLSYARFAL